MIIDFYNYLQKYTRPYIIIGMIVHRPFNILQPENLALTINKQPDYPFPLKHG